MLEQEIRNMFEREDAEQENAGSEALQETEEAGKKSSRMIKSHMRQSKRRRKNWQKSKIKREYQKAYRSQRKETLVTGAGWKTAGRLNVKRWMQEVLVRNRAVLISVCIVSILLVFIIAGFSSCAVLFSGAISNITYGAFTSNPAEMDKADLIFSEMEADLEAEIKCTETDFPDYDEYQYDVRNIGHNPLQLAAYLHAKYESYTADSVRQELQDIFDAMYELDRLEVVENGKRYVQARDEAGNLLYDENGYAVFVEEEYQIKILKVILTSNSLESLISELPEEQSEVYELLMESKGGLQQLVSPVDMEWQDYVSSYYGYRIHPLTRVKELHRGIDVALPEGLPVYAAHAGRVDVARYSDSYGNYVVITDANGVTTKYAHMSSLQVTAGQEVPAGTQIGTVGNTGISTGSHLHMEVLFEGVYYNPLFYVDE